ncbi:MAG: hypothetical protein KZY61_10795 [Clostridiaceae bacterium]|nr:hypothetical protein [Clostridiaceae bacterium]MBW4860146.1 hypothetical protein [Clostridiaceae bacterium]MBW4869123.1 hypothetical protein [Clostridiaceae bacterium]
MEINGFFENSKLANETVKKLKSEGFKDVYLDNSIHYIRNRNFKTNFSSTNGTNLSSDIILNSRVNDTNDSEEMTSIGCSIIVKTNETNSDKAEKIIKGMGGIANKSI